MIPGSVHPLLAGKSEYKISNSLRFRAANSAYLSRTPSSSGNLNKWTYSFWMKRGLVTGVQRLIIAENSSFYKTTILFDSSFGIESLRFLNDVPGSLAEYRSSAIYRDPSAWYHILCAVDTTNATDTNRMKMYVNGSQITMNIQGSYPTQNVNTIIGSNNPHVIGATSDGTTQFFDGYMAEINYVNGQTLTPSSFGQTDSATGVWMPKKYSGTYGTNGFYLKFADASAATAAAIGKDSSGNGNNFTPNGISVTSGTTFDQMTDTPTLNYPVWSPIDRGDTGLDVTNGNLGYTISNAVSGLCRATFAASTGKWYWEMTAGANWTASPQHGISPVTASNTGDATADNGYGWESAATSRLFANGAAVSNYGTQINSGDVLMIAVDFDAGKIWYGRNGTWFGSPAGDPAAGTNQSQTITTGVTYAPMFGRDSSNATTTNFVNFGQRAFSYTPPTGFKALNTANLPTPSIKKGSLYMDATLRTGTGATASVSSLGFQPDLVWIKSRSAATVHNLFDSSRGVQNVLEINSTRESTRVTSLTAFNSNGYTIGSYADINTNTATYVDWTWKEGATPGFDIVLYVGNATNRTISHNLGVVPHMMIVKQRSNAPYSWPVYHRNANASPASGSTFFNLTNAFAADSTIWNSTLPTSSVFSVGTADSVNKNNEDFVAYLWSEVEGFSKISSYTGNGSTDGPFVWCGFRPRFVLIKSTGVENWSVQDSARNPYNVMDARLKPNSLDAEGVGSAQNVDFLSNGFKLRTTDPEKNSSSVTYIFAAFAETPFKYARAR